MAYTSKQIKTLKSLAMTLKPLYQIGKDGLSNNFIEIINKGLEANELLKIRVLNNSSTLVKEAALDISSKTNSFIVQVVGKVITLFKESKEHKIKL